MRLSILTERMIKDAYGNGKFAQIHEYYKIANWKIVTDNGYRIPSIFDLEAMVRSLCKSLEDHGCDYAESGGIFVKLSYDDLKQEELSFGFKDIAAVAYKTEENVTILDQNGHELKIISVDSSKNNTVYKVQLVNDMYNLDNYKQAIKNKIWGKEND